MDPYKGVVRWSIQRAKEHFRGVIATVIGIPVIGTIVAVFVLLPKRPTRLDRVENGLLILGCELLLVALLAFLYAILCAPYEQRRMLRRELLAKRAELGSIEDSISETLTLADVEQMRTAPSTDRPNECCQLRIAIAFRNDSDLPIKYAVKSGSVELSGVIRSLEPQGRFGRIAPGQIRQCIVYFDLNPTLSGPLAGFLEYRVWYGTLAEPDMYEQECRLRFVNHPAPVGQPVNYSYTELSMRDERRQQSATP